MLFAACGPWSRLGPSLLNALVLGLRLPPAESNALIVACYAHGSTSLCACGCLLPELWQPPIRLSVTVQKCSHRIKEGTERRHLIAEWIELAVIGVFLFADWPDSFRGGLWTWGHADTLLAAGNVNVKDRSQKL
jgi:hypothetical protein